MKDPPRAVTAAEFESESRAPLAKSDPSRPVALVVDDIHAIRRALTRMLYRAGYEVLSACEISTALDIVGSSRVDIIICDICMPDGGGTELLNSIRQAGVQIPVILMTGVHSKPVGCRHAHRILFKPFDRNEVLQVVRDALITTDLREE